MDHIRPHTALLRPAISGGPCVRVGRSAGALLLLAALLVLVVGALAAPASADTATFHVRPGSWMSTGIQFKKGDSFTVSATGLLHYPNSTETWGPGGYYNLGFFAYNLKGRFGAGNNTLFDIGTGGSFFAPIDGELQLGITRTYEGIDPTDGTIQGEFVAQVATTPSTSAPPSTTTPTTESSVPPALQTALACDTGSLQDSGQITCTAGVSNQAPNAQITYQWTFDGQVKGATGDVLTVDNVAVGDHQVSETATDVVNNVTAGPETASFSRSAATSAGGTPSSQGGIPSGPPPTSSSAGPVVPPPTLGPGGTAPPGASPPPQGVSCQSVGLGVNAEAAPPCPVPVATIVGGAGAALAAAVAALAALVRRWLKSLRRRACDDLIPRARHIKQLMDGRTQKQAQINQEWTNYSSQRTSLENLRTEIDGACGTARWTIFSSTLFNGVAGYLIPLTAVTIAARALAATLPSAAPAVPAPPVRTAFVKLITVVEGIYVAFAKDLTPSNLSPHPYGDPFATDIKRNLMLGLRGAASQYAVAATMFNKGLDGWKAQRESEVNRIEDEIHNDVATLVKDKQLCPTAQATDQPSSGSDIATEIVPPYASTNFTDDWLQNL